MNLSPHFTLAEAIASQTAARRGWDNNPPQAVLANMKIAAQGMEKARAILNNKPILISSWYRSPQLNKAVKGAKNSAHMTGWAIDFICPGFSNVRDVCRTLAYSGLGFDQIIYEFDSWCHISFDPQARGEVLTINKRGTYRGII